MICKFAYRCHIGLLKSYRYFMTYRDMIPLHLTSEKRSPTASNSYMLRTPQGLDAFNELSTSKWDFKVHAFINFNYNPLGFR